MAGFNGIAWFEIGTDDPAGAEKFYGEVFGWTVRHGDGDGPGYQMVTAGDGPGLHAGGLFDTGGHAARVRGVRRAGRGRRRDLPAGRGGWRQRPAGPAGDAPPG